MSNVYILPRNFAATTEIPVAFQQGQRPIKMIKTGTVGGRILNERRTVRLQGMPSRSTNSTRRVLITPVVARQGQQNASRANYQFQPIAPATSELIPLQPAHLNGERTFSSFAPQQPIFIQENQQFSEEDNELDIGEVYKLLDESAGQRVNEFVNLPKRRERLTNLTLEQKMLRRKQKNRIAAQAARDRKKETNKRLEETLKRALQEIRRLRGELKFLQAQNSQLLAIKNGQNIEGKITQPQEHVFQPMPLFLPKQEILMSQAGHEQYFDSFQASAGRNKMKQNSQSSDKSSILSTNPSHQPVVVNTSLHQASPQSDNSSPLQQGSLGSAESFNDLLPWERESSPEVRVKETEKVMEKSKLMKRNKDKMPLMTIGQKAIRMACMIKVFTALWSIVCEKRETSKTNKSCNKSSTNFLKKWTFQSMWTASATKSLKKALLRRMWLMDNAKLLRLCKSPQRQLVANLLMRTNLRSKYRLKQESIRKNSTLAQMSSNIYVNNYSPLNEEELSSSTESTDEEDYQIVPQLH